MSVRLKAQKEQLLVERELLRQELASQELGDLDSRRLAEALTRFQDLVRQLPVEQQKELIALWVDRIELSAKSRERSDPGTGRLVEVRLRLHAAQWWLAWRNGWWCGYGKPGCPRSQNESWC